MLEKRFENRVAIVTGGARGIGRAIAARLLEEGAWVAICGTRQKSVDEALALLSPKGRVFGMATDVSSHEDVRSFVAAVKQEFGDIHILVNNAGLAVFQKTADLRPEEWRRMIDTNLSGVYYCCHEVLPVFRKAGGGDVVNISSLAAKNAFAGGAAYNASKSGLNALSEAMMLDYRNEGIRVSTIMPGSVDTALGGVQSDLARETHPSGASWKIAPEDIADIVVHILRTPRRTMISAVEVRPSRPPVKT